MHGWGSDKVIVYGTNPKVMQKTLDKLYLFEWNERKGSMENVIFMYSTESGGA